MSAGDFLAMGGYGFYVWGSYIVAVVVIVIEVVAVRARLNAARRMPGNEELRR
jgi:heme exporter protein D